MGKYIDRIYVWNNDLDYCRANVDLNDAEPCDIYLYPHKDILYRLTSFTSTKDYEELQKQCDKLVEALEKGSSRLIIGAREFSSETDNMAMHRGAQMALIELQESLLKFNKWKAEND